MYAYGELLIEDSAIFNLHQYDDTARTTLRRVLVDDAMNPDAPLSSSINLHGGALIVEDSTWTDTV